LIKLSIWHFWTSLSMSLVSSTLLSFPSKTSPCQRHRSLHLPVVLPWCCKNARFHCSCRIQNFAWKAHHFFLLRWWQHHRYILRNSLAAKEWESSCLHIAVVHMYVSSREQNNEPANFSLLRESCRMVVCATKRSLQNINLLFTFCGHSKLRYIDWWEIKEKNLLLTTSLSTGRVCDFWYSSVALYNRLGWPDDC